MPNWRESFPLFVSQSLLSTCQRLNYRFFRLQQQGCWVRNGKKDEPFHSNLCTFSFSSSQMMMLVFCFEFFYVMFLIIRLFGKLPIIWKRLYWCIWIFLAFYNKKHYFNNLVKIFLTNPELVHKNIILYSLLPYCISEFLCIDFKNDKINITSFLANSKKWIAPNQRCCLKREREKEIWFSHSTAFGPIFSDS